MDQSNPVLQEDFNAQKIFNVEKYNEFLYKTEIFDEEDLNKDIDECLKEHEMKSEEAIFKEQHRINRSKTMVIVSIVKEELSRRQQAGFIRKDFSEKDKNNVALRFIELYHKVRQNQILAQTDHKFSALS